jgi:2-polyprenyl-3-methyl-5-hydroxy-6-metoxy-1,4-benzoquinol methylase
MAFYSDFAGEYEKIFPLREGTLQFLDQWLPEEGRILDLGCGTGHYCGRLAETGRDCLGIDLDPGMVMEAEKNYPRPTFRILDLAEVRNLKPGSFSGIYCIGNVLPHLPSQDLRDFLASLRKLLRPGGRWIFQTVNFDPLLHLDKFVFPILEFPEDDLFFHRNYSTDTEGNFRFQTSLIRAGMNIFSGETTLYPRISTEYLAMHQTADFNLMAHFADFTGREFAPGLSSGSVYVYETPGK